MATKQKQVTSRSSSALTPESRLELERAAFWWIPKLLIASLVFASIALVNSVLSFSLLFMSEPLPVVQGVTQSGVIFDVNAIQR